jgi:hypothetical protein
LAFSHEGRRPRSRDLSVFAFSLDGRRWPKAG